MAPRSGQLLHRRPARPGLRVLGCGRSSITTSSICSPTASPTRTCSPSATIYGGGAPRAGRLPARHRRSLRSRGDRLHGAGRLRPGLPGRTEASGGICGRPATATTKGRASTSVSTRARRAEVLLGTARRTQLLLVGRLSDRRLPGAAGDPPQPVHCLPQLQPREHARHPRRSGGGAPRAGRLPARHRGSLRSRGDRLHGAGRLRPGLPGRTAAPGGLWQAGYRYVRTLSWQPGNLSPAPLTQPFWFSDDGFPELLEISAHAWHDGHILTGQIDLLLDHARRAGLTLASCVDVYRRLAAEPQMAHPAPRFAAASA